MTTNKQVLNWIEEIKSLVTPKEVIWIDGSEEQLEKLRQECVETGELIRLNQEKLPGCYLHRSAQNDVARVEGRTFICCRDKNDAGPTNNWEDPQVMYARLKELGLNIPAVTEIFLRLKEQGIDVGKGIYTVDDGVKALSQLCQGRVHHG